MTQDDALLTALSIYSGFSEFTLKQHGGAVSLTTKSVQRPFMAWIWSETNAEEAVAEIMESQRWMYHTNSSRSLDWIVP